MIALFKLFSKKKKETKPVIYWTNCDIPAKVFFHIMHSGEFDQLGTDKAENLESAFNIIFDEYIEVDNNTQIMDWYTQRCKVENIRKTINMVETCLHHITFSIMTHDELLEAIRVINLIKGVNVRFDINKDPLDEIIRIQQKVLGSLQNDLNFELSKEKDTKEDVQYHFEEDLVSIENVLERSVPEDMSLRKFVFLKKSAIEKSKRLAKIHK